MAYRKTVGERKGGWELVADGLTEEHAAGIGGLINAAHKGEVK